MWKNDIEFKMQKIVQLAFLCSGGVSLRRARERQTMRAEARRSRQRRTEEEDEEESVASAAAERRGGEEEENDEGQVEVMFEILEQEAYFFISFAATMALV